MYLFRVLRRQTTHIINIINVEPVSLLLTLNIYEHLLQCQQLLYGICCSMLKPQINIALLLRQRCLHFYLQIFLRVKGVASRFTLLIQYEFKQTNMFSDASRKIESELFHFLFPNGLKIIVNAQCFSYLVLVTFRFCRSQLVDWYQ